MGLLDSLPLSYIHVFPYSDRPGTKASAMPDTVSHGIRRKVVHAKRLEHGEKELMLRQIGKSLTQ